MRSITNFTGKVSETDFNNWEKGTDKEKMLYIDYGKDDNPVARFCSLDEAKEIMESEPDFEYMQEEFEEDYPDPEKELFGYYGFYATSKDFIKQRREDNGTYKYKSSGDGSGVLTVSLNI